MAVIGACEGAVIGPIYAIAAVSTGQGGARYVSGSEVPFLGMVWGAIYAACIGFIAGSLSFLIAGIISCTTRSSGQLFKGVLKFTATATALGVLLGAVTGSLNAWIWNTIIMQQSDSLRGWPISGALGEQGLSAGLFWGVIIGFTLATFWGGITGALREARKMQMVSTRDSALDIDSQGVCSTAMELHD